MTKSGIKEKAEFLFSKKIYRPQAVKRAVRDYSQVADIKVKDSKDSLKVSISGVPDDQIEEISGEFCNYVLYLLKE